jgi:UPF0271 protein
MGESFGAYRLGQDEALMNFVSSVNIACGFHAGDPTVMRKTVNLALRKNIAIGAHPGYPDLQGFGRRGMQVSSDEVYDMMIYQVGALMGFVRAAGGKLHHVKPHGALYNTAAKDRSLAAAMVKAVHDLDPSLVFTGLSGSVMIKEAKKLGLKTASEVFSDRTYQDDGTLTPRTQPDAMIEDSEAAARQVLQMVTRQTVTSTTGKEISVVAETVCIHGDGKFPLDFASKIVTLLQQHDVGIQRP